MQLPVSRLGHLPFTNQPAPIIPGVWLSLDFNEADRLFSVNEKYGGDGTNSYLINQTANNAIANQRFLLPKDGVDHRARFYHDGTGTHLKFTFTAVATFDPFKHQFIYFTSPLVQDIGFVFTDSTSMQYCETGSGWFGQLTAVAAQKATSFNLGTPSQSN